MEIRRTVLHADGGTVFVYTTSDGQYLGRVRVEALDAQGMELMARDVVDYLEEQKAEAERPQIVSAVGRALRGN